MGLSYNADSRRRNLQTLGPVLARVLRHDVGDWCQLGHRASSPVWPRSKLFICSGREVHRPNMGRWPYPCECAVHISSNHPMTSFFLLDFILYHIHAVAQKNVGFSLDEEEARRTSRVTSKPYHCSSRWERSKKSSTCPGHSGWPSELMTWPDPRRRNKPGSSYWKIPKSWSLTP